MPTIVPLNPETEWLPILRNVDVWDLPCVQTLVIAPHPDDETLGAGGLIAKLCRDGMPVTVAAVTNGENAYDDTAGLDKIRVLEQMEALHRLGLPDSMIHRLNLPDRNVAAYEDELVDLLLPLVTPETHIIAPWCRDFHPDHEAVGRAAARVSQLVGSPASYYLFWTWHRGTPEILNGHQLTRLALSDAELSTKLHALQAHTSQFEHADGQPILSPELLAPAHRTFEVYIR